MGNEKENINFLAKYLPENAVDYVYNQIVKHKILFKITKPRATKLGDYMSPNNNRGHKITINSNLNKYAFFLTFLHELAHLKVWEKYKNRVSAHGKQWISVYKDLIQKAIDRGVFPVDLVRILQKTMFSQNGIAGNYKTQIHKILENYDDEEKLRLDDIGTGHKITLRNGRQFIVLEKIRKRYKCKDVINGKLYIVNHNAQVVDFSTINDN